MNETVVGAKKVPVVEQPASPAWVERQFQQLFKSSTSYISATPYYLFILFALTVGLGMIWAFYPAEHVAWWNQHNPFGYAFLAFHWVAAGALLLIGAALPKFKLPTAIQLIVLVSVYALIHLAGSTTVSVLSGVVASYALPLAMYWSLRMAPVRTQITAQILIAIVAMLLLSHFSGYDLVNVTDRGWRGFRPERYMMVALIWIAWRQSSGQRISTYGMLSPIHLVYPLPVSPNQLIADTRVTTSRKTGLLQFALSLLSFAIAGLVPREADHWLGVGALTYIYFYFNSWAVLNFIVGLGRWLGFPIEAPFKFAMLAVSPADSWRRWNIPFYYWFRNLIFVPVLRKTNLLWLSVLAVFLVSFWLHDGYGAIRVWNPNVDFAESYWLRNKLLFFILHAVGVYVSLIASRWIPKAEQRLSWVGVAATFIWLSVVHWWARGY